MAIDNKYDCYYELRSKIINALMNNFKSINEIYLYLSKKYSKEEIKYCLNRLLTEEESIVRDDYYYNDSKYQLVDDRRKESNYTKHYREFTDDNPNKKKKILLISDTHIGNKDLENMYLINKVYEYAKDNDCEIVFHQGDLFEGNSPSEIETFIKDYPNTIRTICLIGNHDKNINNIKRLIYFNDSFNIYEVDNWSTTLNSIPIHLSHRLYISWLIEDQKIDSINDLDNIEEWISNDYKLLISGHLHQGIIYSANNYVGKEVTYIGVPSLSKININKAIADIITIDNENINVSVLTVDNNYRVKEIDNIDLNEKHKVLKKVY